MDNSISSTDRLMEINSMLRQGLATSALVGCNWLDEYNLWSADEKNSFDALLTITDSFNLNLAGDSCKVIPDDKNCLLFFDNIKLSVFYSQSLFQLGKKTVEQMTLARNPATKENILKIYFDFIEKCKKSKLLAPAVVILNDSAETQSVLHGVNTVDLYISYYVLLETLRCTSVESIFLLFTYWRITQNDNILKRLLNAISDYIKSYFYDYQNDPDMHLDYNIESLSIIKKLTVIQHWTELITFHTKGIMDKYKKLKWLLPVDILVDNFTITNQISKYEMLRYKLVFESDCNDDVKKKAICNHGYGVWIKTTDIMHILYEISKQLYHFSDNRIKQLNTNKKALLELQDNFLKLRDAYTGILFEHRAFYQNNRLQLNSSISETQEKDAIHVEKSIDDILQLTSGFINDDIDSLIKSKQQYIEHLSIFITEDREKKLDDYISKVAQKIQKSVKKLKIYDTLYAEITEDFKKYSEHLLSFSDIFCSLTSAEYLYSMYVKGIQDNNRFDYSCISIMYYMSLEEFVNKLVYTKYVDAVLDPNIATVFDPNNKNSYKKYVSHKTNFYDAKNKRMKRTCEIGNLGFLLEGINQETEFKAYLQNAFPKIDISRLITFGSKLKNVAHRRNLAAHGGNIITYAEVCADKLDVFSDKTEQYRGLILELLDILYT